MDPEQIERQLVALEERVTFFEQGGDDGVLQDWEKTRAKELRRQIAALREHVGGAAAAAGTGDAAGSDDGVCETDDPVQNELTDRDWTTLRTDFVQAVQIWCDGMRHVVNQFEKNVGQAKADPSDVTLAVKILDGLLSDFIPKNVKMARAVVEPIVKQVLQGVGSGKVNLRAFCETWDGRFDAYKSDRGAHDTMFEEFRRDLDRECGGELSLEFASERIQYLADELPNSEVVRRALLRAWIDSSEDESAWLGDVVDSEAGYFHVTIKRTGADKWELMKAYLDDTDEQAGVIKMLQKEYPKTKLESLPFPMKVFIHHGIKGDFTKGEKGRSGDFKLEHGMQDVLDAWTASSKGHPTTADLSADSIL